MRKSKLIKAYYGGVAGLLDLFKDEKAHVKKLILAMVEEMEGLPFPVDWTKGKEDAYYWHTVYEIAIKHFNQLANQSANNSSNQSLKTLKEV
ncbi:hypothetical protein [Hydrogenobacter hydrogenophilus]|nr:hypothetical protein [Hydrogenobacter hydrogenophilus]